MNNAYPTMKQPAQANDDKRRSPQQVQQTKRALSPQQGDAVFWSWAAPSSQVDRSDRR